MPGEPTRLNSFLMLKLPSAWLCGVRIKEISHRNCKVGVRHRWINQNPFGSLYFAVQAMAAELSTGALVMSGVRESGERISMLVKSSKSTFTKKATGRITFESMDGDAVKMAIEKAVETGEGQTFWMDSVGINEEGVVVSNFSFEWTLKLRKQKGT